MSDNAQSNLPTHIDDYQPPQSMAAPVMSQPQDFSSSPAQSMGDIGVPNGFNPPPAPQAPVTPPQNLVQPVTDIIDENNLTDTEKILYATQGLKASAPIEPPAVEPIASDTAGNVVSSPSDVAVQPSTPATPATPVVSASPDRGQSLEAQNIFDLLGVADGKPEEKEAFLDELQDVIWEDFLSHDAELLLTPQELTKLDELKAKGSGAEVQEEILVFLEKLIPDLEDMMMDKAIELKEDMVMERIAGLREFHSQNAQALEQITNAEKQISEGHWADAAKTLNAIK